MFFYLSAIEPGKMLVPVELCKLNPPPLHLRFRLCLPSRSTVLCALGVLWIMTPDHTAASDQELGLGAEAYEILVESPIDRRVDLKRTLLTSGELPQRNERHALSRDERDALNRELREAITGLYEKRAEERASNRAGR